VAEYAKIEFDYADVRRTPTRKPPLIGLIGKARAGKDTFARRLVEKHGYQRIAFADPLKAVALAIDPIVVQGDYTDPVFSPTLRLAQAVDEYGWDVAKEQIPEVRRFLQHLGAAMREKVRADLWLNLAMREVDARTTPVVITDVRYRNEAEAIAARGGKLVRIVRPGAGAGDANATHASETELDDWPAYPVIENRGTVPELHAWADWLAVGLTDGTY
jgi:hypothetical protein